MVAAQAAELGESGAVDGLAMSDQLCNFFPPSLWNADNAPMAALMPDPDSLDDAFIMGTFARAAAPQLGLSIATDAVRHGPAQLFRAMMTLANITEGHATLHLGAGEIKQLNPYGWKRNQGLRRFEDMVRLFEAFWKSAGPIDFEGNFWNLKSATLGGARGYRPQVWAMGNGPKLIDLATTYCDGLTGAAPLAWTNPDRCAERVSEVKQLLVDKGRDPEEFGFGIFATVLLHEDAAAIDHALDNPLVRWLTAVMGRINPEDWELDGLESPVPDGWTYHMDLQPFDMSHALVDDVLEKTTRAHAEKSFIFGTPEEVAASLKAYADAGVTWIAPVNYLALVSEPDDAMLAGSRTQELCRILKQG